MSLLIIIFKILNFAVLVFLARYAIQRYLVPFAYSAMQEYDNFLIQLLAKKRSFQEQEDRVRAQIHEQDLFFLDIEKKFSLWQQALEKELAKKDAQQCMLEEEIQNITAQRLYNLQTKLAQKQLFPKIIQEAESEIVHYYNDARVQDRYTNVVIANLKKRIS